MRVAIIGSGLQCARRAPVIFNSDDDDLIVIAGKDLVKTKEMAREFKCDYSSDWIETITRDDIDLVVVCTPPNLHAEISIKAMKNGKHVLCEKPLSRTLHEAEEMIKVSKETNKVLKCGFNHRHHPAIFEAKKKLDSGEFGKVIFSRCRYGICGRPGFEKEWRANPEIASGGHFIEQGVHIIDLFRWFMGDIKEVTCMTSNHFFKNIEVDDGGMALFRSENGATASMHTTLAQWKNLFSFEIFCENGYLIVEGLGASYGEQKLIVGRRDFSAPFKDETTYFRGGDKSWKAEWDELKKSIFTGNKPLGDARDGLESLKIALCAYQSEKTKSVVDVT